MVDNRYADVELELDDVEEDFALPLEELSVLDSVFESLFESLLDSAEGLAPFSLFPSPLLLSLRA